VKVHTQDFIQAPAKILEIMSLAWQENAVSYSWNGCDCFQRYKINSNLFVLVMELETFMTNTLRFSGLLGLFVEFPRRHRDCWDTDKCNDIGDKADRIRP
jgi:hypothetical protein